MRNLIVSAISIAILIGSWLVFYDYSEARISSFTHAIDEIILPLAEEENWSGSLQEMEQLSESWHQYKRTALLFLDTEVINEIDYSIARSLQYIKARDISNSSGELLVIREQLKFLSSNDRVSMANIL